ncbi:MAG TPA: lactate racemase domain-containing protein [Candidatus Anammoximicrobium sp.]|nr:lactate racemase domain-containing protein [Candidatus Anammoximicrobium sp.]
MPEYPQIFRLRQSFERPRVADVAAEVHAQLTQLALRERIQPGQSVAITAGSRGIANMPVIVKAIVDHLRSLGAQPFIVPAMGSHAGGTAEGQQELIEEYGITEPFCGCPIRSSMDTVVVCRAREGFPVHFDRFAAAADHVVVCGRVKPHTSFAGDVESGLMKMMLIGLGKHDGAKIYHRAIMDYSFDQIIRSVAREVLSRCRVVAGVAIVENSYDETAKIAAVRPEEFETREKELLVLAKKWLPRLPFDRADILLIDELGKDISGTGMDTNVVGRKFAVHEPGPGEKPEIRYIAVRGLTAKTRGNATGLGLAEFCRSRVLRERDVNMTRINSCTGGDVCAAMTPLDYETDREILDVALPLIGLTEPRDAKLIWIRDTLHVEEVACSVAYLAEARQRPDLEVLSPPVPLPWNAAGNLPDRVSSV